jgi:hypothetical protein
MSHWPEMGVLALSFALWIGWPGLKQMGPPLGKPRLGAAARFLYFIGLPYLSLILGILAPKFLGLRGLEYLTFIEWGGPSALAQFQRALILILANWLLDSRPLFVSSVIALLGLAGLRLALARQAVSLPILPRPALERIYELVHWAFYWGLFWSITDDLYLGVVLGSFWAGSEMILGYRLLNLWPARQQQFLGQLLLLILMATLFFYSPNLWLLLPVHLLTAAMVARPLRFEPEPLT